MSNIKNKKKLNKCSGVSLEELQKSRNGGQSALRGYSYQFLYSCYLILSSINKTTSFQLEGMEDIDCIEYKKDGDKITHIQSKYSINKQDASFLKDVLKNFLEVYLKDKNRYFKLVYDFSVANGNLSKILNFELDDKSKKHWENVILDIKNNNSHWNWEVYNFDDFISKLQFEKIEECTLVPKIEKALIEAYDITTDNISLFINSIEFLCFEKMKKRSKITKDELDAHIEFVKLEISKGPYNPANSWIRRLNYFTPNIHDDGDFDSGFYEGKKATLADIEKGLPIRRQTLEQKVMESIQKNTVTVIKASSGQGKTTLALQVANNLKNEYTLYELICCNQDTELGNIVEYFKSKIKIGEKIIILIDNLDSHLSQWNRLVQLLQSEIYCHYKLIITSREIDWYNYGGDLSNIKSLKIIKPVIEEKEAMDIFNMFKNRNKLHSSITDWKKAWNKIKEKQLLIEYVYLLTHGEMLSERISAQICEIDKSPSGKAKCEILRKVCFANICGVRLPIRNLFNDQSENLAEDFGELLKSMESEFLIHVNIDDGYIEGLHPVRSKHIVDRLHQYTPIDYTAISIIKLVKKEDLPILFSHFPEFNLNKDEFCINSIEKLWNKNDLSHYIYAIQGLFSGSVMQYYNTNKDYFNDANFHGGLFIISTEMCPFRNFNEFNESIDIIDNLIKAFPQNENLKYFNELKNSIPICNLCETFVYRFCYNLYKRLCYIKLFDIDDIESYASICEWIYCINSEFNLSTNIILDDIWFVSEKLSLKCISSLMYISFCGNRQAYMEFVYNNLNSIITYLKHKTESHKIFFDNEKKEIHVKYVLRLRDIKRGNDESFLRLKYICKTLPIFELYCADALKPALKLLNNYNIPDDAHKKMSLGDIIITFHEEFNSLWYKTIMSNYEFDTVTEWIEHWFHIRKLICILIDKCCKFIYRILELEKSNENLIKDYRFPKEIDRLHKEFNSLITCERRYPREERPFEENPLIPQEFKKIKRDYFQSMRNFFNQFLGFLKKDNNMTLAMTNIILANSNLAVMQKYFLDISVNYDFKEKHMELSTLEIKSINQLIMSCTYYQNNTGNRYFDKYQIKKWYEEYEDNKRKTVEKLLANLQSKYSISFPNKTYTIGILSYYPVIIHNFDITQNDLYEFIIDFMPFVNTPYDYLVILWTNYYGEINSMALQICKQKLMEVKDSNDGSSLEKLQYYPVDVTEQMLKCFDRKYNLPIINNINFNSIDIGDIAQELWIYSISKDLLTGEEDIEYLESILQDIKTNIKTMLDFLKTKFSQENIELLEAICKKVFNGKKFDNELFNSFIDSFNT